MSATAPAAYHPAKMRNLSPHLVCKGAMDAIAFYQRAFGAVLDFCLPGPEGTVMNAQLRIGEGSFMLVDEAPAWGALGPLTLKGTPVTLHLFVPEVDAAFAQAVAAGAKALMAPADMFWGDRYSLVEDPFGHRWSLATHLKDLTLAEIQAAMAAAMPGPGGA